MFTGYEFADENGKGTGKVVRVPATITYKEALKNTTIFTSTVMFDMEQLSKEQLQMPQIKSEDTALWWRILRQGYVACGLDENFGERGNPCHPINWKLCAEYGICTVRQRECL